MADHGGRDLDIRPAFWLLCRLGAHLCALPLENVLETMRPLPIEPLAGAPRFVRGLSIVRGSPIPVLDGGLLFDAPDIQSQRWVTIDTGGRLVALAADDVLGVRSVGTSSSQELPPLLGEADSEIISAIGTLDTELLLFLSAARIVPQALHERLIADGGPQ